MAQDSIDTLLTATQLADRWSLSVRTLANQRSLQRGCPFTRIGSAVRYRLDDVFALEQAATVQTVA